MVLGLLSCGAPKMDSNLVKSMTTGFDEGVVCGISVGDDWEDVKNNIHKEWELNGEGTQFIKEWDDFNNVILSIDLDSEDKVWAITLAINGKEDNHLLIAEIQNALQKELNSKLEAKDSESWSYKAPNGDECGVMMGLNEQDSGTNSFSVTVYNLTQ